MHASPIKTLLMLLALALLSGCGSGSREVRGELPLVTLDGLERQGEQITLQLGLRNINDRPLQLNEVQLRLLFGTDELVQLTHAPDFEIGPRGRDVLRLRGTGQAAGLSRLDQLEPEPGTRTAQARSIAWRMQVSLTDERGRTRDTEITGFLHPVPGQPGRFR